MENKVVQYGRYRLTAEDIRHLRSINDEPGSRVRSLAKFSYPANRRAFERLVRAGLLFTDTNYYIYRTDAAKDLLRRIDQV